MFVKSRSNWYSLDWSGTEHYRYCCQWMEKVSSCLCSHSGPTLQAILLQAFGKIDNWIKCQPKCQKCEQNVFYAIISYWIKSDILLIVIPPGKAETNVW